MLYFRKEKLQSLAILGDMTFSPKVRKIIFLNISNKNEIYVYFLHRYVYMYVYIYIYT